MELSKEAFNSAFNSAPRPVRSFIVDGKLDVAVADIVRIRQLHVDAAGILEKCASQMLVGVMNPAQVLGELVLAGVDAETAKKILEDLNQQIFIPVRDKVRHFTETGEDLISPPDVDEESAPAPAPEIAPQATPIQQQAPTVAPQPVFTPVPEAQPAQYAYPPAPVAVPTPVEQPLYQGPPPVVQQPTYQPVPVEVAHPPVQLPVHPASHAPEPAPSASPYGDHPAMRTMATDMRVAQEHPAATPLFTEQAPRPVAPLPVPAPAPEATPSVAPFSQVSEQPAPTFAPPSTTVPTPEAPLPVTPGAQRVVPPPPNLPGAPLLKQYGSDPYREPLS